MTTQEILQGVHDWTNGKIVYDISVAHPDGQGNPTKYADLAAALGTNGANIPQNLRKGGMQISFVRTSDNKYVQFRLMKNTWSIKIADWQGVYDKLYVEGNNLISEGGIMNYVNNKRGVLIENKIIKQNTYLFGTDSVPAGKKIHYKLENTTGAAGAICFYKDSAGTQMLPNFLGWGNITTVGDIKEGDFTTKDDYVIAKMMWGDGVKVIKLSLYTIDDELEKDVDTLDSDVTQIKEDITYTKTITSADYEFKRVKVSGSVGETASVEIESNADWKSLIVSLIAGERISGSGYSAVESTPVFTVVDENGIILKKVATGSFSYTASGNCTCFMCSPKSSAQSATIIELVKKYAEEALKNTESFQTAFFENQAVQGSSFEANVNLLQVEYVYGDILDIYKQFCVRAIVVYNERLLIQTETAKGSGAIFSISMTQDDWDNGKRDMTLYLNQHSVTFVFKDTAWDFISHNSGWQKKHSYVYPLYVKTPKELTYIKEFSEGTKMAALGSNSNTNLAPISPEKLVINSDNILKQNSLDPNYDNTYPTDWNLPVDVINPNTPMGRALRFGWCHVEDENGYLFDSFLEPILSACADDETKITMAISDFSGHWGTVVFSKPADYDSHPEYASFMQENGLSFDSNNKVIKDGLFVKDAYPNKYFWAQVADGTPPIITKDSEDADTYSAYMNYNSPTIYTAKYALNQNLYLWLNGNLQKNGTDYIVQKTNSTIKRKDMLEVMMARWGFTGEGIIYNKGVFPTEKSVALDYFKMFTDIYTDIPVTMPMAIMFDDLERTPGWTIEDIIYIFNLSNTCGLCNLEYDMIGYNIFGLYNTATKYILDTVGFGTRKIHGEPCSPSWSQNHEPILRDSFYFHLSGASLHNLDKSNLPPLDKSQIAKYLTVQGAKLYLSEFSLDSGVATIGLQNIGYCKVFSRFWKPILVYKDANGDVLDEEELSFSIQSIAPTSQSYDKFGVIGLASQTFDESVSVPNGTKFVYFGIKDDTGIYQNYHLHNYGRTSDGLYLVKYFE